MSFTTLTSYRPWTCFCTLKFMASTIEQPLPSKDRPKFILFTFNRSAAYWERIATKLLGQDIFTLAAAAGHCRKAASKIYETNGHFVAQIAPSLWMGHGVRPGSQIWQVNDATP
ncbi:hypothetical protein CEXT_355621 [Caerostris extrusa]|uniref:Uncharacterized protein n=1 Tax=Caerostris extrusa TaxID=172846 RepID=A0AAV4SP41_CAEEX|nr:hypothetical protein CEXT_355621 [Caerostris extrusa]